MSRISSETRWLTANRGLPTDWKNEGPFQNDLKRLLFYSELNLGFFVHAPGFICLVSLSTVPEAWFGLSAKYKPINKPILVEFDVGN